MAKRESILSTFFLTQMLMPQYWHFDDKDLDNRVKIHLVNMDVKSVVDELVGVLNESWEVEECYAIMHDKDVREVWDEKAMEMTFETKAPHLHMAVKFKNGCNRNATLSMIADTLGVEVQYIEKPKTGRYSWDNQLAYLIHAKDRDKYQYDHSEVYTAVGESYSNIYCQNIERWERGAVKKSNKLFKEGVEYLEYKVLSGQILRPQIFLSDELYQVYSQNKRRIDDAFDTYGQKKMYQAIKSLENGEFKTKVYYILGKPGSGKTRFVKDMIRSLQKMSLEMYGAEWQVCTTASTNPVDDYNGEEILFMDDVRGSTMRADDWLKLLDPWNISPSSARYRNKMVVARVIFITATMKPWEFFYFSKGVGSGRTQAEAVDQFLRRLAGVIQVIDIDKLFMNRFEKSDKESLFKFTTSNSWGTENHYLPTQMAIYRDDSRNGLVRDKFIDLLVKEIMEEVEETNS